MEEKVLKNDPFELGHWRTWLRSFALGESEKRIVKQETDLKTIRATISILVARENMYFKTSVYRGEEDTVLTIKRIDLEEWSSQPKRRFIL